MKNNNLHPDHLHHHHQHEPTKIYSSIVVHDDNESVLRKPLSMNDKDVDKLLSEKLNNLSMEERTQGIHELHGVAEDIEETPDMIRSKLQEMTQIADNFKPSTDTSAYHKAREMNNEYVESIKLLCLRAANYDSNKAASRLVAFFSYKQSIFGDDQLARDILYDDFEGQEREDLKKGSFQLLQERDRAGRAIIMFVGAQGSECTAQGWFRSQYYVTMTALRDPEIQKKGAVVILYLIGTKKFHSDRPPKLARSFGCLPIKVVAVHACYDKKLMDLAIKMFCRTIESQLACRFRGHYGSYLECIYNLMTFGIPKHVFPISMEDGSLDLSPHHQCLEMMHAREQATQEGNFRTVTPEDNCSSTTNESSSNNNNIKSTQNNHKNKSNNNYSQTIDKNGEIVIPGPLDIIVGRGYFSRSSAGYLRMRNLVQSNHAMYELSDKYDKTQIMKHILKTLKESGCRFVRYSKEGLIGCNDTEAGEKISHSFRNMRRTVKKEANRGDRASSMNNKRDLSVVDALDDFASTKR